MSKDLSRSRAPWSACVPAYFSGCVSGTATDAEIELAFREKAKVLHPDMPHGDAVKFKELLTARDRYRTANQ